MAVSAQCASDLLQRFDTAAHSLLAPEVQEHSRPARRVVRPELLKVFFEEIGADSLQVVAEEIAEADLLLRSEIFPALEYAPARLRQKRRVTVLSHPSRFGGADLVEGLVQFGDDVKAIENVEGLGAFCADHIQVGLPHV